MPCQPWPAAPCCDADKARDKRTGELVALKKLRMERERDGAPDSSGSREWWPAPATSSGLLSAPAAADSIRLLCKAVWKGTGWPCRMRMHVGCVRMTHSVGLKSHAGMPVTSVRELRVLQTCKHPNLVELKRVVTGGCPPTLHAVLAALCCQSMAPHAHVRAPAPAEQDPPVWARNTNACCCTMGGAL